MLFKNHYYIHNQIQAANGVIINNPTKSDTSVGHCNCDSCRRWLFHSQRVDYHSSLQGNSFTNWARVTPRHEAFVNKVLQSNAHFICTMRSKVDYVLSEKNGKQVPEKVGLKAVQRDNLEYEFTCLLELNMQHMAKASKDRTGLFTGKPEFIPTIATGKAIADWCNQGEEPPAPMTYEQVLQLVRTCTSIADLNTLYQSQPRFQQALGHEFTARKHQLNNIVNQPTNS